jgi:hypothetical protein
VQPTTARRDGRELTYAEGPYWTYAKRYYLSIVKVIPADLLSGAVGDLQRVYKRSIVASVRVFE